MTNGFLPVRSAIFDAGMYTRIAVADWIAALSKRPTSPRFTVDGPVDDATLDAWMDTLALDAVPARVTPRFGLVGPH